MTVKSRFLSLKIRCSNLTCKAPRRGLLRERILMRYCHPWWLKSTDLRTLEFSEYSITRIRKIACVVGVPNHRGKSGAREYEVPASLCAFHVRNGTNFWPPLQKPIKHATLYWVVQISLAAHGGQHSLLIRCVFLSSLHRIFLVCC